MTDRALVAASAPRSSLDNLMVFAEAWNYLLIENATLRMTDMMNRHIATSADLALLIAACPHIQTQQISVDPFSGTRFFKFTLPNNMHLREHGSVVELADTSGNVLAAINFSGVLRYAT